MTVNSNVSGKARGAIPAPSKRPLISKTDSDFALASTDASRWFHTTKSGDYVYGARGTKGVYAIGVSDPTAMTTSDSNLIHNEAGTEIGSHDCRGCAIIGNTLVTCSRGATGVGSGLLETWDISTPGTLTTNVGVATDVYASLGNAKYSAMDTDGTHVYVAGQVSGVWKFDVSTITAISLTDSNESGSWECQGIAVHGGYCFVANYVNGLRIINTSDMGVTTDVTIARPTVGNAAGRPWDCVVGTVHGVDYLFVSTNRDQNADDRGLLCYDITTPASMTTHQGSCLIPQADIPPYANGGGDPTLLGISFMDNYVYMGNGTNGIAVFDVNDPTRPKYVKTYQINDSVDWLSYITTWKDGGKTYCITGDALPGTTGSNTNKLYSGEIVIK